MKYSYEDKIEMYRKWKNEGKSSIQLAREYGADASTVSYMIRLQMRLSKLVMKMLR